MIQVDLRPSTLVEIAHGADGQVPVSLISAAYQASRAAYVMLVLNSVTPREVDDVLDSVVARCGHTYRGLVYARLQDESTVLPVAASADRVFAASDAFRASLASCGIAFDGLDIAEAALMAGDQANAVA